MVESGGACRRSRHVGSLLRKLLRALLLRRARVQVLRNLLRVLLLRRAPVQVLRNLLRALLLSPALLLLVVRQGGVDEIDAHVELVG